MRVQDLRIGNIIGFKNRTDCYCTVSDLSFDGDVHVVRHFNDGVEDDQPEIIEYMTGIPLTQEWILKFGGEKSSDSFMFDDIVIEFSTTNNNIKVLLIADDPYCAHKVTNEIKYVHQFQNLYFALKGKELNIINLPDILNDYYFHNQYE
jgi:regulatory protein YycH of two-component signal transduction system YycFG